MLLDVCAQKQSKQQCWTTALIGRICELILGLLKTCAQEVKVSMQQQLGWTTAIGDVFEQGLLTFAHKSAVASLSKRRFLIV